ncbi:MAG: histidine phosphatase family protein [Actinomycetales bacterium]|nr:histidine phosphatase family protein [Actinomycetales bacterium]
MSRTLVHLLRHGEVHNPEGVLYGRIAGYRLSERGEAMARRIADVFTARDADLVHVVASPLERAQQTATPVAQAFGLVIVTDERLIEAGNHFEGLTVGSKPALLLNPVHWPRLVNPFRPSWGEPYTEQLARMFAAIRDARRSAEGHEAVVVSHQLPIWMTRLALEGRPKIHDPRRRKCSLASLTSLAFDDATLVSLTYSEPCADLLLGASAVPGA